VSKDPLCVGSKKWTNLDVVNYLGSAWMSLIQETYGLHSLLYPAVSARYFWILAWDTRLYLVTFFHIHGSVHRNSILIRSNKMQQYAGIYLRQNHSTCFGCPSHPSLGVHKSVTAASGTGHSIWATTFLRRGLIRPRWRNVVAQILWPAPEAAVTVLFTPDDWCDGHPKHIEWFCSKQIPAYCCILLDLINIE